QRTLRATIDWSAELLEEPERALLARLGVFEGGFSLEAAEAVASAVPDVLSALSALVDNSLVQQHEDSADARFSVLATVREYALERLGD
ncbi:LuxR family transcriptional regulator, partial [Bacillus sp. SIMBA_069]